MLNKINSRNFLLSLISVLFLSLSVFPSGGASATEINTQQSSNARSVDNISPLALSSKYVTVSRRYSSLPPATIKYYEWVGLFEYGGELNLFNYEYDPDAGLYFATYKGNIYPR